MVHILIVESRFYEDIADAMLKGATAEFGSQDATFEVVTVPGAFEIPAAIRFALAEAPKKYDGFLALGCVIRGETSHYDYVCGESARGLTMLALEYGAAIGYGILTCENMAQAWERADIARGNKGAEAAAACLRMVELREHFRAI